jgi:hypothetical protein
MKVFSWVLLAVVIYWLILKLTNHSPTLLEIFFGMQMTINVVMLGFMYRVSKHMGRVEQYMKDNDRRFAALASDFKRHLKEEH